MNKECMFWDNPKKAIYYITAILLFFGCINVFSASYITAQTEQQNSYYYLVRYLVWAVAGLITLVSVRYVSYQRLMQPRNILLIYGFSVALLLLVPLVGIEVNGARRWLGAFGLTFQPSEVVKVAVIMLASCSLAYFVKRGRQVSLFGSTSIKVLGLVGILAFLVAVQPDKGTAGIIVGLAFGVFIAAGIGWKQLTGVAVTGIAAAGLLALSSEYSTRRLHSWLDPWSDAQGAGYQAVQAQLSIGSGGLWGMRWGGGYAKYNYLPEAHTDFAYAVFCQETGFIGAIVIISLFVALAYAFLRIAFNTRSEKGYLLVSGLMLYVAGQACANIAMVCGMLPVIGVPLPLISYGGTSMVTTMGAIGLVLSVYDEWEYEESCEHLLPEERRQDLQFVERRRWTPHE